MRQWLTIGVLSIGLASGIGMIMDIVAADEGNPIQLSAGGELLDQIIRSGPVAAVLFIGLIILWRTYRQETHQMRERQDKFFQTLLAQNEQQTKVIAECRDAMRENAAAQHRVADVIEGCTRREPK